jgi:type III secretion protein R
MGLLPAMMTSAASFPDPLSVILILVSLSLLPFLAIMITSFIKIVVVLGLVRNALGIQQIPPNTVINGLALILTIYIMAPVAQDTFVALEESGVSEMSFSQMSVGGLREVFASAREPIRNFLVRHSSAHERTFFVNTTKRLWNKEAADQVREDDLLVLVPAFTVSELTSAFQIGFLIYLPFIIIDLITSNILLAMGMMMVSPMTISLPFKLLLFVLVDGWTRLIHGLVLTYI